MNLVEFPFATLSDRNCGLNVLEFQVETFDRETSRPVTRRLTVTGDAKYGLPTATDEEVYLGLLQLTKLHNEFSDPRVLFTRSELISVLGWKNRDWSYHRVSTALSRLTGVRLFYENAWRDNTKKRFRSRGGFGLLDSFEIRDGRVRSKGGDDAERLSEFRWNSVVFDSFQAGYLKKLDYGRVRELSVLARRIYRYLDKHFHPPHRTTLIMNLRTFACEHIGISRSHDSSQVKRALRKPIADLEAIGFLAASAHRYRRVPFQRGEWEVVFTLAGHKRPSTTRNHLRLAATVDHSDVDSVAAVAVCDEIDDYWNSLDAAEQGRVEAEAVSQATGFLREILESNVKGSPLADECCRQIVKAYLRTRLHSPVTQKSGTLAPAS